MYHKFASVKCQAGGSQSLSIQEFQSIMASDNMGMFLPVRYMPSTVALPLTYVHTLVGFLIISEEKKNTLMKLR